MDGLIDRLTRREGCKEKENSEETIIGACDSSLPEEEEVLGRGLFLACESNSQKRSDENQDG